MTVGGSVVESIYDDAGMRIARIVNGTDVSVYFGKTVEIHNGELIRHFYANGRRIAFSPIAAPPGLTLAALPTDQSIMLARAARDAEWLRALPPLGPDPGPAAGTAGCAVLLAGTIALCVMPLRSRRGRLHPGRTAALVIVYVVLLPAWPAARHAPQTASVALAQCVSPPSFPAYLVHLDHLASTTLLTAYKQPGKSDGEAIEYYRYGPYGQMQAYTPSGSTVTSGSERTEVTYTSQRWDAVAQLYDYQARFYDSMVARFMSTDPARENMSPYAYVGWNPMRFNDPTGKFAEGLGNVLSLLQALGSGGGSPLPRNFPPEFQGRGGGRLGDTSVITARGQQPPAQGSFFPPSPDPPGGGVGADIGRSQPTLISLETFSKQAAVHPGVTASPSGNGSVVIEPGYTDLGGSLSCPACLGGVGVGALRGVMVSSNNVTVEYGGVVVGATTIVGGSATVSTDTAAPGLSLFFSIGAFGTVYQGGYTVGSGSFYEYGFGTPTLSVGVYWAAVNFGPR